MLICAKNEEGDKHRNTNGASITRFPSSTGILCFVLFCFVLFCCPYGMYAYRRMSFGLCNAPASFQRCMMSIFSYMIEEIMEVFMDDFSVYGKTFNDCLNNLDKVLQ
jgi:hypothetical protein